jgi:hypothetical protein
MRKPVGIAVGRSFKVERQAQGRLRPWHCLSQRPPPHRVARIPLVPVFAKGLMLSFVVIFCLPSLPERDHVTFLPHATLTSKKWGTYNS